jgi:hypothetical protein
MDYDSVRGGCFIGNSCWTSTVLSWPLITLRIGPSSLRLEGILSDYEFPKSSIRELVVRQSKILRGATMGLQIVHDVPNIPPYVRFETLSVDKLRSLLDLNGFQCVEKRTEPLGVPVRTFKPYLLAVTGLWGIAMGLLTKWRLLPFLRGDTILSGGKMVSTGDFANSIAPLFFIIGAITIVFALTCLIRERRKISSPD